MKKFIHAVEFDLKTNNWYAALALSLTFPDVCGRLEAPDEAVGKRYVKWYDRFMLAKYSMNNGPHNHVFLSGQDCYLLRCTYLHEGGGSIVGKSKAVLDHFHFISPPGNNRTYHKIQRDKVLLLQVDVFCRDMVEGVKEWERLTATDPDIILRKSELLKIHDASGSFSI